MGSTMMATNQRVLPTERPLAAARVPAHGQHRAAWLRNDAWDSEVGILAGCQVGLRVSGVQCAHRRKHNEGHGPKRHAAAHCHWSAAQLLHLCVGRVLDCISRV